jgi:hypothetical protein
MLSMLGMHGALCIGTSYGAMCGVLRISRGHDHDRIEATCAERRRPQRAVNETAHGDGAENY